jgi:hypothetical protein
MYQDPAKPVKLDDLSLRKEIPAERLKDRFELLKGINGSMPDLEKALGEFAVDEYYGKAYDLVLSGKARDAIAPRGQERLPDAVMNAADAQVRWNSASLISAIKALTILVPVSLGQLMSTPLQRLRRFFQSPWLNFCTNWG